MVYTILNGRLNIGEISKKKSFMMYLIFLFQAENRLKCHFLIHKNKIKLAKLFLNYF